MTSWPSTVPTFFCKYHGIKSPEQMPQAAVRTRISCSSCNAGTGAETTSKRVGLTMTPCRMVGPGRSAPGIDGILDPFARLQTMQGFRELPQRQAAADERVEVEPARQQVLAGLRHVARREVEAAEHADLF